MVNARRHRNRSVWGLLVGASLAALLAITGGGAAFGAVTAGAESVGAGIQADTDVFIRDFGGDTGIEWHGSYDVYQSPDIKVCHGPSECVSSLNPVAGATNYLFITLRNPGPYGSGLGTGRLYAYYTSQGGAAAWTTDWNPIGSVSASVPAGTTTVMVPWHNVPGPGHFCLLVRWVSTTDPMTFPEGVDTIHNTRQNNNIAWRNVNSVDGGVSPGNPGEVEERPFDIRNTARVQARHNLVFEPVGRAYQEVGGRIVVDLGPTLFERWRAGGMGGRGIRQVGETQVEIVDPAGATIAGIVMNPFERLRFKIRFVKEKVQVREGAFGLKVEQVGPDATGERVFPLGGVGFNIVVGQPRG